MSNINCNGEIRIDGENIFSKIYPIGSIYLSLSNTSPANLFGGTWEMLPEGYALWTAKSTGEGGQTIAAGLPNITGKVEIWGTDTGRAYMSYDGEVFKSSGQETGNHRLQGNTNSNSATKQKGFTFDASKGGVDPIYGKATTVQPPAIKVYAWKRVS